MLRMVPVGARRGEAVRKSIVKLVIAVIQPTKLSAVREALDKIEVARMTVTDAQGFGRSAGAAACDGGDRYCACDGDTRRLRHAGRQHLAVAADHSRRRPIGALLA